MSRADGSLDFFLSERHISLKNRQCGSLLLIYSSCMAKGKGRPPHLSNPQNRLLCGQIIKQAGMYNYISGLSSLLNPLSSAATA